jgi:preprotein translocase subunit SecA
VSALSQGEAEAQAGGQGAAGERGAQQAQTPFVRDVPKVGRNEPCPCGSGKKYKVCHGKIS